LVSADDVEVMILDCCCRRQILASLKVTLIRRGCVVNQLTPSITWYVHHPAWDTVTSLTT